MPPIQPRPEPDPVPRITGHGGLAEAPDHVRGGGAMGGMSAFSGQKGLTHLPARAATILLLLLVPGTVLVLVVRAGSLAWPLPADLAALRFTLMQATLSALISVALAIPVARALARRRFAGREALIALMGAPFILPVVAAVLGLLAVFGRNGLANQGLAALGLPGIEIYGLHGVVLAHVFFNMPLATRLILQGWQRIPAERFRLAASLGFSRRDLARQIEWPMLHQVVPGALLVVFLLCLTSFAVVLTLGGGPRASTLELAIYQAFRLEFDLPRVAMLALAQLLLCGVVTLAMVRATALRGDGRGMDREPVLHGLRLPILGDALVLMVAAMFLLLPMVMVAIQGVPEIAGLPGNVWHAAGRSLGVALVSTLLAAVMGLAVSQAALQSARAEVVGMLALAASPVVMGAGLFVMLLPLGDPAALALPITAVVNAVMALPLVLRSVVPALRRAEADHGRLADMLGMRGWARLRWLILPRLRQPLGFAAGIAAALSMGDLGVIALFSDPAHATLPMQISNLMGAYRMEQAAGAAVVLAVMSFGLFWLCDRWGRANAAD